MFCPRKKRRWIVGSVARSWVERVRHPVVTARPPPMCYNVPTAVCLVGILCSCHMHRFPAWTPFWSSMRRGFVPQFKIFLRLLFLIGVTCKFFFCRSFTPKVRWEYWTFTSTVTQISCLTSVEYRFFPCFSHISHISDCISKNYDHIF